MLQEEKKLVSMEGTTQKDLLAMAWYSLNTTMLIETLKERIPSTRQVWLADDAAAAGGIRSLKEWYETLIEEGSKVGYHVNNGKSWLIL